MTEIIEKAIQTLKDGARRVEFQDKDYVLTAYKISDIQWRIDLKLKS